MPSAPQDLSVHVHDHNTIHVTWGNVVSYTQVRVLRDTEAVTPIGNVLVTLPGEPTEYTDSTCLAGTLYYYAAQGYLVSWSNESSPDSATTSVNAPTGFTATAAGTTSINLAWTNGESTYNGIYVEYKKSGGSWSGYSTEAGSATSKSVTGLDQGTTYDFRLLAWIGTTYASYSDTKSATTTLTAPSGLAVVYYSPTQVQLTWSNGATYTSVRVERKVDGGSYAEIANLSGEITSYINYVDVDVKHHWRVRGMVDTASDYATSVTMTIATAAPSATCAVTATAVVDVAMGITESATCGVTANAAITWASLVTATATCAVTANVLVFVITQANFAYYFGDSAGAVYLYDDDYKADNGDSILAYWKTKDIDFSDQDPTMLNRYKTVYRVKIIYVDQTASTPINLYISTDGGTTWSSYGGTFGTGARTTKHALYHMIKTGEKFMFRIEVPSATADFQLVGMEIEYEPAGEYAVIN